MTDDATLEQQVRDYLRITLRLQPVLPPGWNYRGPADLVLQTGRLFTPASLPARYSRGPLSYCFENAYQLARRSRGKLRYCEGYAAGMLPCEHAWCIDAEDRVLDPTWENGHGQVYLGVVVDLAAVRAVRRRGTTSALFDWFGRYPLCRQPDAPSTTPRA